MPGAGGGGRVVRRRNAGAHAVSEVGFGCVRLDFARVGGHDPALIFTLCSRLAGCPVARKFVSGPNRWMKTGL